MAHGIAIHGGERCPGLVAFGDQGLSKTTSGSFGQRNLLDRQWRRAGKQAGLRLIDWKQAHADGSAKGLR